MEAYFSGDIEGSHYRPRPIDLTQFDLPPLTDYETGELMVFDWELPDAMIVTFPKNTSAGDHFD